MSSPSATKALCRLYKADSYGLYSLNFLYKITEIVTKSLPNVSVRPSGHLGFFNVETPRRSVRAVTAHLSISVEKTDEIFNASIYYPKK